MSVIKVNKIENTGTTAGGVEVDSSGHVQVDGVQMPTAGALSNRNLIINGAMQVAQRGTSTTGVGNGDSGYYTVDRFRWNEQGAPSCEFTVSQSTTAPDGFSNSYRVDTTTAQSSIAAADTVYIDHRIEAQNLQHLAYGTSAAKSITISFYVKSTVTGTYAVWLYNQDGGVACTNTYTISSANTWEYKTFTVAGDTSNSINNDDGIGFFVRFVLCAGTDFTSGTASTTWASASVTDANRFVGHTANIANATSDDWAITGIQLEVGEKATPFEHRSFGDELLRCKRYFVRKNAPGYQRGFNGLGMGTVYTTSTAFAYLNHDVEMRSAPTLDHKTIGDFQTVSGSGSGGSVTDITISTSTEESTILNIASSAAFHTERMFILWSNTNGAYIDLNAEL